MWGFPIVRQYDLMQCGAACLAMICRFYGKEVGLRETERLCTPGKRGVSMQRVKEGAESLGLDTCATRCACAITQHEENAMHTFLGEPSFCGTFQSPRAQIPYCGSR